MPRYASRAPSVLEQRLIRSHLGVALIGMGMLCIAAAGALWIRDQTLALARTGEPAAHATTVALHGLERSVAGLRGWLITGDPTFERERARAWAAEIMPALMRLRTAASPTATKRERREFAKLERVLRGYRLAQERVSARAVPGQAAVAEDLMAQTTLVRRRATALLTAISHRQHERLEADAARLARVSDLGMLVLMAMIAGMGGAALIVARRAAARITAPIAALARATTDLAARRLTSDIPVQTDDEIGDLTHAFNGMRSSVVRAEAELVARAQELARAYESLERELHERREVEAARRELAAIVECSEEAIIGKTCAGIIVSWNAAAERMYGFTAAEMRGRPSTVLVPAELGDEEARILERVKQGEGIVHFETRRLRRDGSAIDVSLTMSPIRDGAGAITGVSTISRDTTERKRAEEAIRKLNAELEERVRERTAELERSNAELQQFAYVASHDLQEPLRMVASYTQLLGRRYKGLLDADADEFIGYAVNGALRMQKLIRDLLAYSRVGNSGNALEPTDCEAILGRTLANLNLMIEETDAKITYDSLPQVWANPSELGQLLQNLIANALKFRSMAPARVHVGAERHGDTWLLSVRDNGIGIDSRDHLRIFAIFQRLHRAEEYSGTGIGLAMCKKIVERHGGRIWVESTPGEGSTFWFTLASMEGKTDATGAAVAS